MCQCIIKRFAALATIKRIKVMALQLDDNFLEHDDDVELDVVQLEETDVVEYLRQNPQFFQKHPDIMSDVVVPERWTGDEVVDLQRVMLDRNSSELDELRNCAQEVIETSRNNMSIQTRTHASVLAAVSAKNFRHLVQTVNTDWPHLLNVDMVSVGFEPSHLSDQRLITKHIQQLASGKIDHLIGVNQDICLYDEILDYGTLFASSPELVRSAAFARIRPSLASPHGVLVLGSYGDAFHPRQGSELIGFLVRILEILIHRELALSE
jgi:uncharacterized protein YigA (DUF484 family)